MKKFLVTLLALLCLTVMTACKTETPSDTSTPANQTTFIAKVLELRGDTCLARPVNSEEMREVFLVEVPAYGSYLSPGNYVKVTCDAITPSAVKAPLRIDNADVTLCNAPTPDVPPLHLLPLYTEQQLSTDMKGVPVVQIYKAWGEPYSSFSGMYGDVYYTDITRQYEVAMYYESNGTEAVVESIHCQEVPDAPTMTRYKYEGDGLSGDFVITLYSDGKFQYTEGALSSYIGMGKWTKDTNGVICLSDQPISNEDGTSAFVRRNYFTTDGSHLVWVAAQSNGFLYVNVKNGDTWTRLP